MLVVMRNFPHRTFFCLCYPFPKSLPSGKGLTIAPRGSIIGTFANAKVKYHIKTVREQDLNRKRNLKRAADNMIYVSPGSHKVMVRKNGRIVYDERVRVGSDETKLIY